MDFESGRLVFLRSEPVYGDVHVFHFKAPTDFDYEAGSSAQLVLGPRLDLVREMSFASAPSEDEILFCAHTGSESEFKRGLRALSEGQEISLMKFAIPARTGAARNAENPASLRAGPAVNFRPTIFAVGGIGAAPARSILMNAGASLKSGDYTYLHYESAGRFIFEEEISALPIPQWRFPGPGYDLLDQRVVECVRARQNDGVEPRFFVAGSEGFVRHVRAFLHEEGIPEARIHLDSFG